MIVAVVRSIRGMIMRHVFMARPVPVALIILLSVVVRHHPDCALIRRTAPVPCVPLVMAPHWVPISPYKRVSRSGAGMPNLNSGRRRGADVNADADLAEHRHAGKYQQSEQF